MTDRGNETSRALTEVRTVLSRAETAADMLAAGPSEYSGEYVDREDGSGKKWVAHRYEDPEQEEMLEALQKAVALLSPWRRVSGRRRGR